MESDLPTDMVSEATIEPSVIEEFKSLKNEIIHNPNDIKKWLKLFNNIDEFTKISTSFTSEFKDFVNTSYNELLSRFPNLVEIWQKFSIISYKILGERESIEVLGRSIVNCPYSLDLWRDYINALEISNNDDLNEVIERGIRVIGYNFNSGWLWDKYLTQVKNQFTEYQKLIKIPLYEYSKYYTQFLELSRDQPLHDILNDLLIKSYEERYGKSINDLTIIEKSQICEEVGYLIFQKTQGLVNSQWEWESKITINYLDLTKLDIIKLEIPIWMAYINWAIEKFKLGEVDRHQVISLFERCLIPNCFEEMIWLKYLAFINLIDDNDINKFNELDKIYNRAINKFLPLDTYIVRFSYAKFLQFYDKTSLINDYIFDLMKYFSGDNHLHRFFKSQFLKCFETLLSCWHKLYPKLNDFITSVIDIHLGDGKKLDNHGIDEMYSNSFMKYVTDESVQTIVNFYLKNNSQDINMLREFFNKYHTSNILKSNIEFWKFFVNLEINQLHFPNIDLMINYIINHTCLPKIIIDELIIKYYNVSVNNYELFRQIDRNLLEIKTWTSNSVMINPSLSSRYNLSNNWGKNYDNPGIKIDYKPEIIRKSEFSIHKDYPSPSFRNVERAGAQIPYAKDKK